jgi:hypothetical protein
MSILKLHSLGVGKETKWSRLFLSIWTPVKVQLQKNDTHNRKNQEEKIRN